MGRGRSLQSVLSSVVAVAVGGLVAWAGSQGGAVVGRVPVIAVAVAYVFVVQWQAFIPSYLWRSGRFFDLVGSGTFISAMTLTVVLSCATDTRSLVLLILVLIWAGRLGFFLFRRIQRSGKDDRFDSIKRSFARLLAAWTL